MKEPICDFCSAKDAPWVYDASSFICYATTSFVGESVGAWAACDTCKKFIDAGDVEGLTKHSHECLLYENPELNLLPAEVLADIKISLKSVHRDFFKHRKVS